ncbi:MAG: PDZ domain-containing protein [Ruminococcaceae bacterium]|nr:PDZ domain-containing protein [Oscillospiraceae bacterium]
MNYDEFEPLTESESDSGGYYSTGRPDRKRRVGLAMALSVLAVLCCGIFAVLSLFELHIEREAHRMSLTLVDRNPDVSATPVADTGTAELATKISKTPALQVAPSGSEGTALSLPDIYQKVIPSVVSVISSTPDISVSCTGIIMSADGYIITTAHIAEDSNALTVRLHDGVEYVATVAGSDKLSDLAVLKIDGTNLRAAEFGDSDKLNVGEPVVAIGNPHGTELGGTMTDGIVSGIHEDLSMDGRTLTAIQTNAVLGEGAYGGPIINLYGQVVGISTLTLGSYSSESLESLGFAVPISTAKGIVDELIENGRIPGRPSIGISGQSVPVAAQAYYRLPAGVYVDSVYPGSTAEIAGLMPGDIITAIDGETFSNIDQMNLVKNRYKSGDTVNLNVYRSGMEFSIYVVLEESKD